MTLSESTGYVCCTFFTPRGFSIKLTDWLYSVLLPGMDLLTRKSNCLIEYVKLVS